MQRLKNYQLLTWWIWQVAKDRVKQEQLAKG